MFLFVRVVQAGSFSAAARQLSVPKSTLSRKVAELEERLGARLLQRTTRKLRLTDAGRLHQPQNYVGRILASVFTCFIYAFFWLYNIMDDGNRHFTTNWAWEDSLARALQG